MSINTYIAIQVNLCNLEIALTRTNSAYTKVEISKGCTQLKVAGNSCAYLQLDRNNVHN